MIAARGELDDLQLAVSALGAEVVDHHLLTLDEIFIAHVGSGKDQYAEASR